MTDIREKAEALIKDLENIGSKDGRVAHWDSFKSLKAALRPSREEIADSLEKIFGFLSDESHKYIDYAIEELRKDA